MGNAWVALALASSVIAGMALGQTAPPAPPPGGMGMGGMGMRGMMRADANGDGVVTRAEAIAQADVQFDRMDANHDGTVTGDEMRAAFEARRAARGGEAGGGAGGGETGGRRSMGGRFGADVAMTRDAFRARALARFDRIDANHDGRIDQSEMAALRDMPRGSERALLPPTAHQQ